ncbi:MerR family DNA-binding transcriptional regulator [Rathayibacter sp. AY1E1]|uniref:MerR family DNA-binding transcriptional regulator n=1 Tax=Rathayibacter sp. AY1E1 TaxID=2080549 RepID=UPI000CE8B58C|nr:MerR family DNA-binding transcriptional regulator [Rathayibacter sp. AY1E1]PPH51230.1 hypothetical protein C5C67_11990 [Rathayibacter sp. AY1E1]
MELTHTSPDDVLVGVSEAAHLAQLSADTIRRYADTGKLASTRTPGNQRRFRKRDVLALIPAPALAEGAA